MIHQSHLFHEGRLWVLPLADGTLQTRFRFASLEPPSRTLGIYTTPTPPAEGAECRDLRALFGAIPEEELSEIIRSRGILQWRLDHRFCSRCGAVLNRHENPDERAMRCGACGMTFYPRLSPAVITLITRGDEILLEFGKNPPPEFGRLVAGFIEVGESAEEAVARETREETGICVKDIRYVASQPWPYPSNLMLAFRAEYASGTLRPDGVEVADCRWFTRDNLPALPPGMSIARRLIDAWASGKLP